MHHRLPRILAAFLLVATSAVQAEVTLIHAGELLAVPGKPPAREMTVIVEGDRITGVQRGYAQVQGATVIDLSDSFVLPGSWTCTCTCRANSARITRKKS